MNEDTEQKQQESSSQDQGAQDSAQQDTTSHDSTDAPSQQSDASDAGKSDAPATGADDAPTEQVTEVESPAGLPNHGIIDEVEADLEKAQAALDADVAAVVEHTFVPKNGTSVNAGGIHVPEEGLKTTEGSDLWHKLSGFVGHLLDRI